MGEFSFPWLTFCADSYFGIPPYTLRESLAEVFVDKDIDLIQMLLIHYQIQESKCAKPVLKIVWK